MILVLYNYVDLHAYTLYSLYNPHIQTIQYNYNNYTLRLTTNNLLVLLSVGFLTIKLNTVQVITSFIIN